MDPVLSALSAEVGKVLGQQALTLATAESCTGGWVAEVVTATAGSSAWFERGFITYSNQSKIDMLGVRPATLDTYGAVSEATAQEMARGALRYSSAHWALAITGVAGPDGGSPGKPVGTVCFAWCRTGGMPVSEQKRFSGDREQVRRQAVIHALTRLLEDSRAAGETNAILVP